MAKRVDAGKLALNRGRCLIPFPHRGISNRADAEYPGTPNNEGRIGERPRSPHRLDARLEPEWAKLHTVAG
jgi:hypothetical protein